MERRKTKMPLKKKIFDRINEERKLMKTRDQIIDNLCKKGILNTLFNDEEFGRRFMYEYFLSIDGKDFHSFTNKLVDFISKEQEETNA
tara:strand:+ start:265 stop:528 length:264 start_codon:yes stop_codon:yes gene_type:complete